MQYGIAYNRNHKLWPVYITYVEKRARKITGRGHSRAIMEQQALKNIAHYTIMSYHLNMYEIGLC